MRENRPRKTSPSRAEPSERELLEKLRRKDAAAMRQFYERYADYLTAVCSRYIPEKADAKDILQESFVKMFGALDSFEYRGEGSLKAWSSRIVVNTALKSLRKSGRLRYMEALPDLPEESEPEVDRVPAPVLQQFIQALPDGYRTVFNLFVFEKKSHREIAALLGIKEDSSASQFFRARALLARKIKQYLKENE